MTAQQDIKADSWTEVRRVIDTSAERAASGPWSSGKRNRVRLPAK